MIEMPAPTLVYLRQRKEPMTLEDRQSGMRDAYRRDPDMARLAAQELGDNKPFSRPWTTTLYSPLQPASPQQ